MQGLKHICPATQLVNYLSFVSHLHIAHFTGTFPDIGRPAPIHLMNRQSRHQQHAHGDQCGGFVGTTNHEATVNGLCPLPQELTSRPQDRALDGCKLTALSLCTRLGASSHTQLYFWGRNGSGCMLVRLCNDCNVGI